MNPCLFILLGFAISFGLALWSLITALAVCWTRNKIEHTEHLSPFGRLSNPDDSAFGDFLQFATSTSFDTFNEEEDSFTILIWASIFIYVGYVIGSVLTPLAWCRLVKVIYYKGRNKPLSM